MSFTVAVGEDGYVKDKEIVCILGAICLLLLLFFTKQQPELIKVVLAIFFISLVLYIAPTLTRGTTFVYEKLLVLFLQVRDRYLQIAEPKIFNPLESEAVNTVMDQAMTVIENKHLITIEPEILSSIKPDPVHAVDVEHEPEVSNTITVDALTAIEAKVLEVIDSKVLQITDPEVEPLMPVELVKEESNAIESDTVYFVEREARNIVEPEIISQYISTNNEHRTPLAEADDLTIEAVEEVSFVSLNETRASLRAEAYLKVEHAAAYLGLPIENFNEVAKNKSLLPVKKCGAYYLYKINILDRCVEKLASKAWTKDLNRTNQEKIIHEHGMLTTDKVMIFLNKSKKTLSNWRESRENQNEQPYGPDFIKLNTSVFYNMSVLLTWCESPMAKERKPPQKK